MRIGVIRGDLPGPLYFQDLESISQWHPSVDAPGQARYIGRPTTTEVETALANPTSGAGAVIEGSDISGNFPITINGTNDDLKVRTTAAGAFTTVLIAQAAYANIANFLVAINAALVGTGITARQGTGSGQRVALESNTKGVNSVIGIDSTAGGSVANTPLGFGASAITRTMPPAATFITALNPVSGTLDVSATTIKAVGATTATNALNLIPDARGTVDAVAEAIAPRIYESTEAVVSFQVGAISEYRNAAFNPDPRRGLPSGAAIAVVADDGVTAFTAGLPVLTTSDLNTPSTGILTLVGTGLGSYETKDTKVRIKGPNIDKTLSQLAIEAAGGTVTATAIVIPAALISGATLTTTTARVQVRNRVSAAVAMT